MLLTIYHPAFKLLGITTTHGNVGLDKTTYNALAFLELIGRTDIPVIAGASQPFCRPGQIADDIHGESGLAGTDLLPVPSAKPVEGRSAIQSMYAALMGTERNTAWLIATGPCTNAALLFATHPDVVEHIAGFSIMGGGVGDGFTPVQMGKAHIGEEIFCGNVTPFAEFNIWADPESARSVLTNTVLAQKSTILPLDVSHQAFATEAIRDTLRNGKQGATRLRRAIHELLTFYGATYSQVYGLDQGPPLHDPLAVAVLLSDHPDEDLKIDVDDHCGERFKVDVTLEGPEMGRTVITPSESGKGVRIPRGLDLPKFWDTLNFCLEEADEATNYAM